MRLTARVRAEESSPPISARKGVIWAAEKQGLRGKESYRTAARKTTRGSSSGGDLVCETYGEAFDHLSKRRIHQHPRRRIQSPGNRGDRKSTRLNSSHTDIS